MSQFKLHILGCGSAKPSGRHQPSCQVLEFRNNLMMIDCGEGAQAQFMRRHLKFSRLNHIFISHLHGDHCFGLPGLISTMALHGHGGKVTVHIFEEGAQVFGNMFDFFCHEMPFEVVFNVIKPESAVIYEDKSIRVSTVPLKHRVPAVGFVFEEQPKPRHINAYALERYGVPVCYANALRAGEDYVAPDGSVIPNSELTLDPTPSIKYAYISDTAPTGKVMPAINGADWLYHEATYDDSLAALAKSRYHSTAEQAAHVALAAKARNLIIGHFSSRYRCEDPLLQEAQLVFRNTILANEDLTIELDK